MPVYKRFLVANPDILDDSFVSVGVTDEGLDNSADEVHRAGISLYDGGTEVSVLGWSFAHNSAEEKAFVLSQVLVIFQALNKLITMISAVGVPLGQATGSSEANGDKANGPIVRIEP